MEIHARRSASVRASSSNADMRRSLQASPLRAKRTSWQRTVSAIPILGWLPNYNVARDLKFDVAAGITVAMMLIPQEVSLAGIMHVPPHHSLYTAATAPLVYAIFGSSTVLSVASGSEVSLLVGSSLESIENEDERVATGILMSFIIGMILLLVRVLNLSQIADFFSRPVMGGFISAGGLLISLSQVANWLSISVERSEFPPVTVYNIASHLDEVEMHSFVLGIVSVIFLISLKIVKKRCFPSPVLTSIFNDEPTTEKETDVQHIPSPVHASHNGPATDHGHGFSLTDQQYVNMAAEHALEHEYDEPSQVPKSKGQMWIYFFARTLCDLGPLMVCIIGGVTGYIVGPDNMRLTGDVPSGLQTPDVPWAGLQNGLIDGHRFGSIALNSLTIAIVVYLSSIAMSKRLAIQRGEDIRTDQELMGLGIASVVCGFMHAMPPTGGMSRTAVNLQNARTQVASIITNCIVILSLYTMTGALFYLPKTSLASIIIVAGYSLVEFKEAKWLYRVKRDEFYVWSASFVLTLGLGVMNGLIASIISSVIALMWKSKQAPVIVLGELENGSFVDRDMYPEASPLNDVIALRVESSLYFANCERVVVFIDEELARLQAEGVHVRGVVLDGYHMNDMDATTIQVMSDLQAKLEMRKIGFAIANVNGRIHDVLAVTNLLKRIYAQNPRIRLEDAIRGFRNLEPANDSTTLLSSSNSSA